jgi:hypothetical protein
MKFPRGAPSFGPGARPHPKPASHDSRGPLAAAQPRVRPPGGAWAAAGPGAWAAEGICVAAGLAAACVFIASRAFVRENA